jgi:hypothetical protein
MSPRSAHHRRDQLKVLMALQWNFNSSLSAPFTRAFPQFVFNYIGPKNKRGICMRTLLSFKIQHNSTRFVDTELKAKSVVQIDEEELEDFIHAVDTLMVGRHQPSRKPTQGRS